uniref:Uncharacterized protein AlNc14C18G1871 n=1 Tax=Albugo laibachii Nc14 TaxID=890382 RepID=F0W4P9_9STRA|nr:conserved hypothetical protein [Albugo laibachii Nc14]|eukprot:CCA16084.1 conserved hypothetical protein [Albugo laibachii Nc14]
MGNAKSNMSTSNLIKYTRPTGLYASCPWDTKSVRRLIMEEKLAPRIPGKEDDDCVYTEECPICLLYYPKALNVSTCCKQPVCSECFLQLNPPKKRVCCPFCNHDGFTVHFRALGSSVFMATIHKQKGAESPPDCTSNNGVNPIECAHVATVADREQFHQEFRNQLRHDRYSSVDTEISRSSSLRDSSYLEQLMLMEAIRRSLAGIEDEQSASECQIPQQQSHEDNLPTTKSTADVQWNASNRKGDQVAGNEAFRARIVSNLDEENQVFGNP